MEEWVEDNKDVVLNSLYENLPDFIDGDEPTKLVLKLIVKPSFQRGRMGLDSGLAFEFMLVKNELEDTIEGLLNHFIQTEEYEKCAELVKLKKKYLDILNKPKVKNKKRSKKVNN